MTNGSNTLNIIDIHGLETNGLIAHSRPRFSSPDQRHDRKSVDGWWWTFCRFGGICLRRKSRSHRRIRLRRFFCSLFNVCGVFVEIDGWWSECVSSKWNKLPIQASDIWTENAVANTIYNTTSKRSSSCGNTSSTAGFIYDSRSQGLLPSSSEAPQTQTSSLAQRRMEVELQLAILHKRQ